MGILNPNDAKGENCSNPVICAPIEIKNPMYVGKQIIHVNNLPKKFGEVF